MNRKTASRILIVLGLLAAVYGFAPAAGISLSGVPTVCPSTISMTLQSGAVVSGSLLAPSQAAQVWNVEVPAGLSATYLLDTPYATIVADGGYASGSNPAYFQALTGGPTYGYLDGLFYQADGSCSSGPAPTATSQSTSVFTSGGATYTCVGSQVCSVTVTDTNTYTQSTSSNPGCPSAKCTAAEPVRIGWPFVIGGIVLVGAGAAIRKKGS